MAGESNLELESILMEIKAGRAEPCPLPFKFLKDITGDFSDGLKLGEGGFGAVYKGFLENLETVAVKALGHGPSTKSKQFENEAHLLRVKHRNIVHILGYCTEDLPVLANHKGRDVWAVEQHRLICLEYMPNGSLNRHIKDASSVMNWDERYKMITGDRDYPWSNGTTLPQDYVMTTVLRQRRTWIKLKTTTSLDSESLEEVEKWRKRMKKDLSSTSVENNCRQIKECIEIGLKCVKTDEKERPTAKDIIKSLGRLDSNTSAVNNPPQYAYRSNGHRTCAGCARPFGNEGTLIYGDSHWHHECFKCTACNETLSQKKFPVKDNRPYHDSCYKELFHPRCSVCNNFIPAGRDGVFRYQVGPSGQKYCRTHQS